MAAIRLVVCIIAALAKVFGSWSLGPLYKQVKYLLPPVVNKRHRTHMFV